jgi:6-pyruvoyltetrahydropterin/6-carboxytetrahydropterin synthase
MTQVFCEFRFDAAHHLPQVPATHKCRRVHGHGYRVILTVFGPVKGDTQWVCDYAEIERAWLDYCFAQLDHQDLNVVLGDRNTTSEYIAQWIALQIGWRLPGGVDLASVEVWETASFGARWVKE